MVETADAIIVDESLTSGTAYWALSEEAPPFAHLALTGGAIGQGPPAAVGASPAAFAPVARALPRAGGHRFELAA